MHDKVENCVFIPAGRMQDEKQQIHCAHNISNKFIALIISIIITSDRKHELK